MIIIGTAVVSANGQYVTFPSPAGFNTVLAVRIANYSGDSVQLSNIHSVQQGQELLQPQQQMVYVSPNLSAIPKAVGLTYPPAQIAAGLQVEWSTDPDSDFIGQYPVALPVKPGSVQGTVLAYSNTNPANVFGHTLDIGQISGKAAIVCGTIKEGPSTPATFRIQCYESSQQGAYAQAYVTQLNSGGAGINFAMPINLTHVGDLTIRIDNLLNTAGPGTISLYVYAVPDYIPDVPFIYTDLCRCADYTTPGFTPVAPGAGTSTEVLTSNGLGAQTDKLLARNAGDVRISFNMTTSGVGKLTPGYVAPYIETGVFAQAQDVINSNDAFKISTSTVDIYTANKIISWSDSYDLSQFEYCYGTTTDTGAIVIGIELESVNKVGVYNQD